MPCPVTASEAVTCPVMLAVAIPLNAAILCPSPAFAADVAILCPVPVAVAISVAFTCPVLMLLL